MVAYFQSEGSFSWLMKLEKLVSELRIGEFHILSEIWIGFGQDHLLYLAVECLVG